MKRRRIFSFKVRYVRSFKKPWVVYCPEQHAYVAECSTKGAAKRKAKQLNRIWAPKALPAVFLKRPRRTKRTKRTSRRRSRR